MKLDRAIVEAIEAMLNEEGSACTVSIRDGALRVDNTTNLPDDLLFPFPLIAAKKGERSEIRLVVATDGKLPTTFGMWVVEGGPYAVLGLRGFRRENG